MTDLPFSDLLSTETHILYFSMFSLQLISLFFLYITLFVKTNDLYGLLGGHSTWQWSSMKPTCACLVRLLQVCFSFESRGKLIATMEDSPSFKNCVEYLWSSPDMEKPRIFFIQNFPFATEVLVKNVFLLDIKGKQNSKMNSKSDSKSVTRPPNLRHELYMSNILIWFWIFVHI